MEVLVDDELLEGVRLGRTGPLAHELLFVIGICFGVAATADKLEESGGDQTAGRRIEGTGTDVVGGYGAWETQPGWNIEQRTVGGVH